MIMTCRSILTGIWSKQISPFWQIPRVSIVWGAKRLSAFVENCESRPVNGLSQVTWIKEHRFYSVSTAMPQNGQVILSKLVRAIRTSICAASQDLFCAPKPIMAWSLLRSLNATASIIRRSNIQRAAIRRSKMSNISVLARLIISA